MLISRTPLRISLVGGGSDLPSFSRQYGGAGLSFSIQKYIYLSLHEYFEPKGYILKYSEVEKGDDVREIRHRIIRQIFLDLGIDRVDLSSSADVPTGTGLGSSSAFTVGLLNVCYAYQGKYVSKLKLAEGACQIEIERLGEPIGKQDQYGCALGGINFFEFHPNGTVLHDAISLNTNEKRKLERNLLLFYLGGTRAASQILAQLSERSISDPSVIENLKYMADQARSLRAEICKDVDVIGPYLKEGWDRKKRLTPGISSPVIDLAYNKAIEAGASGAKLLGAGGSGFLLVYASEASRNQVIASLREFPLHEVKVDYAGSVIAYSD